MKNALILTLLTLFSVSGICQYSNDSEGIPDKDLFGNYVIIRLTSLCSSKAEALNQVMKFKAFCDESTYLKFYTNYIGFWQVKSLEKDKSLRWIGGYCNLRRQNKELYELDKKFLQMYCEDADIWQFKDVIKESQCPNEKLDKK